MPEFDSPPEEDAWGLMWLLGRELGFRVKQHCKVGDYEVDYALDKENVKVAVEIDGKRFHNFARDGIRDRKLMELGWRTFRIPATAVMYSRRQTEEALQRFLVTTKPITWVETRNAGGFSPHRRPLDDGEWVELPHFRQRRILGPRRR